MSNTYLCRTEKRHGITSMSSLIDNTLSEKSNFMNIFAEFVQVILLVIQLPWMV